MQAEKLILGVDAEGEALGAIEAVTTWARAAHLELHLLHVVEQTRRAWPFARALDEVSLEALGRSHLRAVVESLPEDLACVTHLRQGDPARELLELERELGCSLAVLARHTKTTFDPLFRGTASKVLRRGLCPTLLLKDKKPDPPRGFLVAMDLSNPSVLALNVAIAWASLFGASVRVAYVFEIPEFADASTALAVPHYVIDDLRSQDHRALDDILAKVDWKGVPHDVLRLEGDVSTRLLAALRPGVDEVLVAGTHGRTGWDRWILGSVAEKLVKSCAISMLVVPAPGELNEPLPVGP